MNKKILFGVIAVATMAAVGVIGYIVYDREVANKDWARTVDREVIIKSGESMTEQRAEADNIKSQFDCENYNYPFTTEEVDCQKGVEILTTAVEREIALGDAYLGFETTPLSREHLEKTVELSQQYLDALEQTKRLNPEFLRSNMDGYDEQYGAIRDNMESFKKILE